MTDFISDGFSAFNSLVYIAGGLICLLIGLLIALAVIQTRLRCVRMKARIAAVRCGGAVSGTKAPPLSPDEDGGVGRRRIGMLEAAGRYYYPVYETVMPDGRTVRLHTSSGSNALAGKTVGRHVTILVDPDEPWEAHGPGDMLWLLLSLVFLVPAFLFIRAGIAHFTFTPAAGAIIAAFLAWLGYKIAKGIKPRSEWETKEGFKARRRERRRLKMESPGGYIMDAAELKQRMDALDRYTMISAPLVALIAAGLLCAGYYLERDMKTLSVHALKTEGTVTGLSGRRSGGGSTVYHPVVVFTDDAGKEREFEDRAGSSPPLYAAGDKVKILYDPASPRRAAIDRGLLNNAPAAGLYGAGSLLILLAARSWIGARRRLSRV